MGIRALWIGVAVAAIVASAQPRFRMKYLDEVGHLGGLDPRTTVDRGMARVVAEPGGNLRFEGHDDAGKPWRVWLLPAAGTGATDIWTADFDRNGRQDLLIAAYSSLNGRCTDRVTIYTLMFDGLGRPVPWAAQSNSFAGFGRRPLTVLDLNRDGRGRAEIATVSCEYPAERFGEDRQISGIYEARDARWHPLRNTPDRAFLGAAKLRAGTSSPGFVQWLATDPAEWPDFLAGFDTAPWIEMRSLLTSETGCGGIRLPILDGRVVPPVDDPCDAGEHDRIGYSDGSVRLGWPPVVIDSPDGRDIFLPDPLTPLLRILRSGYRLRTLGANPEAPDLLWADSGLGAHAMPVSSRLRIRDARQAPLTPAASTEIAATSGQRSLRMSRSTDGGEIDRVEFKPVPGAEGRVGAAVEFHGGWLAEWRSGQRRWLVLHSESGQALSGEMALPAEGDLFASSSYAGLQFVRWENGTPVELTTMAACVEWSSRVE